MLRTLLQSEVLQSVARLRDFDLSDAAIEQMAQVRGYVTIPLVTDHRQIVLQVWPSLEDCGDLLFVATRPDGEEISFVFPILDRVRAEKLEQSFDNLLRFFNGLSHDIRCYAYYRFLDPYRSDNELTQIEFYEIARLGSTGECLQKLHVYAIVDLDHRLVIDFDLGDPLRSTEKAMQKFLSFAFV